MKKTSLALWLMLIPVLACAQSSVKESLKMKSTILGKEVKFSLYFPDGYETSNRRYPVLYLLHGASDNETGWVQFGEVQHLADRSIRSGEASPMLIVMPDAELTWYINNHDKSVRYEDFLIQELIPYIDANFRTRTQKQYRALAGLSMGGYGTLNLALKYPQLFSAAVPMSAAVLLDEEVSQMPDDRWNAIFGAPFGKDLKGKDRLTAHYEQNSPLALIKKGDPEKMKQVRLYIDCGDKDFLIKGNMALHAALIDQKIPHEFRVRGGVHDWTYWRTALPEALKFVTESFHR